MVLALRVGKNTNQLRESSFYPKGRLITLILTKESMTHFQVSLIQSALIPLQRKLSNWMFRIVDPTRLYNRNYSLVLVRIKRRPELILMRHLVSITSNTRPILIGPVQLLQLISILRGVSISRRHFHSWYWRLVLGCLTKRIITLSWFNNINQKCSNSSIVFSNMEAVMIH